MEITYDYYRIFYMVEANPVQIADQVKRRKY